jgi:hypothetical protein
MNPTSNWFQDFHEGSKDVRLGIESLRRSAAAFARVGNHAMAEELHCIADFIEAANERIQTAVHEKIGTDFADVQRNAGEMLSSFIKLARMNSG